MADPRISEAGFDLDQIDRLLSTTRAVRKRLDFDRSVSDDVILECIDLAEQAPTGGNDASRRWMVVRDQAIKDPEKEERVLNRRRQTLKANMQATVEGVRDLVDGEPDADGGAEADG